MHLFSTGSGAFLGLNLPIGTPGHLLRSVATTYYWLATVAK